MWKCYVHIYNKLWEFLQVFGIIYIFNFILFFLQTSTTLYFFLKQNENCETKRPPRRSSQHQLAISLIPIYYTLELCTTCIGTRIYVVSFFKFSRAFLLIESCGRRWDVSRLIGLNAKWHAVWVRQEVVQGAETRSSR